ncbi:MAG TPA: ATP-binding protein [Burkholderiaceae bacterium]|nr:ATP-binding protein [Burkholderiaceae bacterium]
MDIGTNTEISLVHDGAILSASCPSGPALEGGHIGSGMRAAEGAIERVEVVDNALRLQVIGGGVPVGLCGSGVLDALAAFVGAGWIEARGRIVAGRHACIAEVDGVRAITLAEETEERHRLIPAVRFSQHDVRAVQLAKSAIRTGVKLLCAEAGLDESQIHRFVIAGAFGAYIRIESARAIGLLPPLPLDRFQQVGNAAGLGVQQMLSSRERRARAAQIARQARYVELSTRSDFQKSFLQHIGFGS